MVGSIRSLRSALSRARMRSSSAPARRLYPTTSEQSIAASFRISVIARPSPALTLAQKEEREPPLDAAIERHSGALDHCVLKTSMAQRTASTTLLVPLRGDHGFQDLAFVI